MIRHHSTWTAWIGLVTFISLEAVGASTAVAPDVGGSSVQRAAAPGPRQGFELNQGQVGPEFAFDTRGDGYELRLGPTEADLWLPHAVISGKGDRRDGQEWTPDVLRLSYLGAQVPSVVGMERLPGKVHYLVGREPGRWRTNIPTFAAVGYEGLYPGVNLVVRGDLRALEFTFVVAPGANPDAIRLENEGARSLEADLASGGMILRTARSEVRAARPRAYQEAIDVVQDVAVEYGVGSDHQIGFHVSAYDPERPLFLQLRLWRSDSRLTENSHDAVRVAVDAQGGVFVAGRVPIGLEERGDAFVSKLADDDMTPLYTTYLGGDGEDVPSGIAIDGSGEVLLAGWTRSTDFPTVGGVQPELAGSTDAFVAKLNADGSTLLFSTYLGGEGEDEALDIATDAAGSAWVTGRTRGAGFPTTYAARQPESGGMSDAFIGRLSPDGSTLLYASYLGGKGEDEGNAIGVDGVGNVHLAGTTRSADLPIENALQPSPPGSAGPGAADAFVATLSADGGKLLHATYLGGSGDDVATSLDVDASGNTFVAGRTSSADFPATGGAIQPALGGKGAERLGDAFVAKLDAEAGTLLYATLLGGALDDEATGIGADAWGNAWIAGTTSSTDFPPAGGAPGRLSGKRDAFVAEIAPLGDILLRSTFIGGRDDDAGLGVAVSSHGAFVVGAARSIELASAQPLIPAFSGGRVFVTQVSMASVEAAGCPGTIQFDNSAGTGVWQTATNWNSDSLPGPSDDVCIPAGFAVTLSLGTQSINSLTVEAAGSLTLAGSLSIATASQVNGPLTLGAGGTLQGAGEVSIAGLFTWTSGVMLGAGTTNANGGMSISGTSFKDLLSSRILNTVGTTTWTGTGGIRPGTGAVINNSGTWDCQSDATMSNPYGGMSAFNNSGTFQKSAGAGTTTVSIPFNNSLTVDVQSGTLNLSGGGTSSGTFSGPGTLQFGGGTHDVQAASSIDIPAVVFSGGTVNLDGSYNATSATTVSGGTANFNSAGTVSSVGSSLTVSSGVANFSSGEAINTTTLSFSGGTLSGTDTVTVSGLTTWTSGVMSGAGTTNANGGMSISGASVKDLTSTRILNTAGTTTWTGTGGVRAGTGAVINNSGTWDCQSDATMSNFGGTSAFNNSGTFKKSAGAGTTTASIPFNNAGSVQALAGTLHYTGGYTQTAGSTTLNGGALSSTTTLDVQGGSFAGIGTTTANVTSGGQTAPGLSPGILNVTGNYTQSATGSLSVEIGGLTAGTQYDRLAMTGVASLSGTLNGTLVNGFVPFDGDSFVIMTFASSTGAFATQNLPPLASGGVWVTIYGTTSVTIKPVFDSDGDGVGNASDCAPADPGAFAIPGLLSGDAFGSDNETFSWTSAAPSSGSATVHDVMRGALREFPVGAGASEICLASDLAGASITDATLPATGRGFYYLARGRNVCGTGTYGFATSGAERTSAACP